MTDRTAQARAELSATIALYRSIDMTLRLPKQRPHWQIYTSLDTALRPRYAVDSRRSEIAQGNTMTALTVHAIYEDGKLRPLQPLPLQEKESVLLQVIRHSAVQEIAGMLQGLDPEMVREVAEGEEFSVFT
jgi:predicted DNA-binding antitoxin AbrB/MazE fold protein